MEVLKFDISKRFGNFQPMNATNGGPWGAAWSSNRTNFKEYKEAGFPYSRNHDMGIKNPFSHDISGVFPNFDADENDPASYDFACTDDSILTTLEAGTKTFYRLGQSIEHQVKKHHTLPPKDFNKWARICEHIIRHYTEGWADGYELDMPYWEIWNEPDLDAEDSTNKKTWGGTKAQFFDLYAISAKHLKKCFPHLKIGGPAQAWNLEWTAEFLAEMKRRDVPIDFFSWHGYWTNPEKMLLKAENIRKLLTEHGYENAESILDEWNYIKNWSDMYQYSINVIHGMKGAAFVASMITAGQKSPNVDMMMYYCTMYNTWCGAFDMYTYERLKGYYPLMWYGKFYDMDAEIRCEADPENIYSLCGVDKDNKILCMLTNYSDENETEKHISLDFGKNGRYEIYLLDETHDAQLVNTTEKLEFIMTPNSCILIKEL